VRAARRRRWLGAALLSAAAWAAGGGAMAQAEPGYEPIRQDPLGTRLVNLPTPNPVGARTVEILFTHRFFEPLDEGDSHTLWGIDSGADVSFGLAYGLTRNFDLAAFRSSIDEDYELAAKYRLLAQAPRVPFSLALRAGANLLLRDEIADSTRPFAQLLISRQLRPGVNLLLAPSWARDTPRLRDAFNVPVGLTLGPGGAWLIELEYVPENRDLEESVAAWHVAFSKAIGGHIFEITFGNSRATTVDQYLGGDSSAAFAEDDVRLGFNLVRLLK
jgi:hypothetical protein